MMYIDTCMYICMFECCFTELNPSLILNCTPIPACLYLTLICFQFSRWASTAWRLSPVKHFAALVCVSVSMFYAVSSFRFTLLCGWVNSFDPNNCGNTPYKKCTCSFCWVPPFSYLFFFFLFIIFVDVWSACLLFFWIHYPSKNISSRALSL